MEILGDPEEGIEIPKTTLSLLDVGLDHVARYPRPSVTIIPFLQFGSNEFSPGAFHHILAEGLAQI